MSGIVFKSNQITDGTEATVDYIDLGFVGATDIPQGKSTPGPVSGTSTTLTVYYKNNNPGPQVYNALGTVNFPANQLVNISGPTDKNIQASGGGLTATWSL